jgi:hypothetical protein
MPMILRMISAAVGGPSADPIELGPLSQGAALERLPVGFRGRQIWKRPMPSRLVLLSSLRGDPRGTGHSPLSLPLPHTVSLFRLTNGNFPRPRISAPCRGHLSRTGSQQWGRVEARARSIPPQAD